MSGQVLDFNGARPQGDANKSITADEIRHAITSRAREFVEWIFPCAVVHKSGSYAAVGDIYGQPGESLHIHLTGSKAGMWMDWASQGDKGGDLIGLFMATNDFSSKDFPRALEAINSEFLGRVTPEWTRKFTIQFKERAAEHTDTPRPQLDDKPPPTESYTYRNPAGGIIGLVRRHEHDTIDEATGKPRKTFSVWDAIACKAQAPTPRPLYRLPEITQHHEIVFVEGERKADALASVGIEATCIMFGANAIFEKVDWAPIAGKRIKIWPDKDTAGNSFAERLAPFLINLKCEVLVITPPAEKPDKWDAADCIAEAGNPHEIVASAKPISAPPPNPRVRLLSIPELTKVEPPTWLIQDVFTERGLSMVWARSGSLKSFVVLDMGLCIATGMAWHGRAVKQGRVIYLAAEGSQGLVGRIHGWMQSRGREAGMPDLQVIPHGLTMVNQSDLDALIAAIQVRKDNPVFIAIDTVSRTFGSGNPNQPSDMNAFVAACDRLKEATGAHVCTIHHGGKDVDKNEVGNEALRNASDTVIHIRRKDDTIDLINEAPKGKQKDAEEFKTITMRAVKVAYDLAGKEQTTLILNLEEAKETDQPNDEKIDEAPRLGGVQKAVMKALEETRQPLGMVRLEAITHANRGSLHNALRALEEKNLIQKIRSDDDKRDVWRAL